MPLGPLLNAMATLTGAVIGAFFGKYLPEKIRETMPVIFGLISFSLGIPMIVKMNSSLPVVLAILLGTLIGQWVKLEDQVEALSYKIQRPLDLLSGGNKKMESDPRFMEQFIGVLVLFSASGMGIFGALNEGMTGDHTILFTKAILDFFTAIIFATSLGIIVATTVVPQAFVLFGLYFLASFILPLTNEAMIANFSATGGMIMLATGLRIAGIKDFPIINMLPSLLFAMPLTALFY